MDINQKFLINMLSSAIRNEKPPIYETTEIDLQAVFDESRKHDVCAILFPAIKNLNNDICENYEVVSEWKKFAIMSGIVQTRFINQMCKVLKVFEEKKIEVIVLKGVVLRELYPKPEFRTMSDADILCHDKDIDEIKSILLSMGYTEEHMDSKHSQFGHKNHLPIEVHWRTMDNNYVKDSTYLENNIWKNTTRAKMCDLFVLAPSLENQILHLCLHMASHMVYSGFGLRQLCDLVLLIEYNQDKIDWNAVYEGLDKCNIVNFTIAILEICRRLFGFKVPEILYKKELEDDEYINMILIYIFADGIYKKVNEEMVPENPLLNYEVFQKTNKHFRNLKYFIEYIFPSKERLDKKYAYAQKYNVLIPLAWIHRLIYAIFNPKYSINEKSNFLNLNISALEKKTKLLRWLELK